MFSTVASLLLFGFDVSKTYKNTFPVRKVNQN